MGRGSDGGRDPVDLGRRGDGKQGRLKRQGGDREGSANGHRNLGFGWSSWVLPNADLEEQTSGRLVTREERSK
jgi:hypothetical protein